MSIDRAIAPQSLSDWLSYLERIHPSAIDMGLDRVARVRDGLGLIPAFPIIAVAGTNGKGSVCAMLESILSSAGYKAGVYTSPHLLRYNERVRVQGQEAADEDLVRAFSRIEQVRGEVSLTYFEFGTLAAMDIFIRGRVDLAVLEVGLGGRLDAVNAFDSDCAVVTSVDFDHMEYLGNNRDSIGAEKAGIFRAGRPAICGEGDAPAGLLRRAEEIGAKLHLIGRDYGFNAVPTNGSSGVHWASVRRCRIRRCAATINSATPPRLCAHWNNCGTVCRWTWVRSGAGCWTCSCRDAFRFCPAGPW